jgi:alkanesulfonate monooxygenase SsuD/methylene tetrahydromethanopterin reductase-like flavin-dependent oxidoreductase (luciferase family)
MYPRYSHLTPDMHEEPKTTTSARGTEEPSTTEQEEKEDKRPDTIIITSTVFPKTEAEAKQAAEEAQAGAQDPPSIDELMTTPETPVVEAKQEPKGTAKCGNHFGVSHMFHSQRIS